MALIGEDCAVALRFGTVVAGAITWDGGGSTAISGKARRISTEDSVELTNTKGLGDARKLHRAHSGSTRIEIEELVGHLGYDFLSGRVTPIGRACELLINEYSGLSVPMAFVGLVERWKGDIQSGEAQIESLSIMCDADVI